tara:strand:+ start:21 stop:236 length:216 start_codon:yes stop_codon:yes gene_type:complete
MNKQYNSSIKLVDQIEKIRSKNNKNWMDIVRLSLKLDFKETSRILYQINSHDKKISQLAKKIFILSKKKTK